MWIEQSLVEQILLLDQGNCYHHICMKTFKEIRENFQDGRNPQDKGDMSRHGLKGKSITQLKKVRSSDSATPREKQLAHWRINMSLGKKKDK